MALFFHFVYFYFTIYCIRYYIVSLACFKSFVERGWVGVNKVSLIASCQAPGNGLINVYKRINERILEEFRRSGGTRQPESQPPATTAPPHMSQGSPGPATD